VSIFEQPLLIGLTGLLLISILLAIWSQMGKSMFLWGAGVVLAATVGMLFLERSIETDRESVERTLQEIADAVASGEVSELLQYAHSQALGVRKQVETEFRRYDIDEVRITQIWDVEISSEPSPRRAVAHFNASVRSGRVQSGLGTRAVVRYVTVTFEKEGNDWKVVAYEHDDPQRPLQRSATP
jgi:hypothetical protein